VSESRVAIYGAVAANAVIAVTKFIAAAVTDSGAMLSEGIHSLVDTGDGLLLLLGLYLSRRPPSRRHPYGHGLEVYFWSMVVAMAIFGVGGGVSIYEGILHMFEPRAVEFSILTYAVLGVAALFETTSWIIALRSFKRVRGERSMWTGIQTSKDPTTFIVVLEDSAAIAGIVIAAVGITLAHALRIPELDAAASILIGLLLCVVAAILARETWSLLVGESAAPELVESIRRIAAEQPGVLKAELPRTMHLGPELVHVDLDVQLDRSRSGGETIDTARRIEDAIRVEHPLVKRVSLRLVSDAMGSKA
jgi:cation diffusion facilitator family transporter